MSEVQGVLETVQETAPALPQLSASARGRSVGTRAVGTRAEKGVTPIELFFDLVFVFAITQGHEPALGRPDLDRVLHGMLVLTALWWAWPRVMADEHSRLDEGGVRIVMLGMMAAMLVVLLAVPEAFGIHGVLFAVAYLVVRAAPAPRPLCDRRQARP